MIITESLTEDVIDTLVHLMQLNIDIAEAYEQALKNIKTTIVYNQIESFKKDYNRHITELSQAIQQLGDDPPSRTKDLKGFIIKGITALRSMMGETAALKAMRSNEELISKTHAKALQTDLSPKIRQIIERHYQDEKRHFEYINSLLNSSL